MVFREHFPKKLTSGKIDTINGKNTTKYIKLLFLQFFLILNDHQATCRTNFLRISTYKKHFYFKVCLIYENSSLVKNRE